MMSVSQEEFDSILPQLNVGTQPGEVTKVGGDPNPSQDVASRGGRGFLGSLAEGGKELGSSYAKGLAIGADFEKGMVAAAIMPFLPERKVDEKGNFSSPAGEFAWSLLRPSEDTLSDVTKQRAEHPQTVIGRVGNPMAQGVGGITSMPVGGASVLSRTELEAANAARKAAGYAERELPKILPSSGAITRNIVAGAGMGEFADVGGKMLGGVLGYFDPDWKKAGEVAGNVIGGIIGGPANITRVRTMGKAGQEAAGPIGAAAQGVKSVFQSIKAKDGRDLWEVFSSEYSGLRDKTIGLIQQWTNASLASVIKRDMFAKDNVAKFVDDANVGKVTPLNYGLAEITKVPTLTATVQQRVPKDYAESLAMRNAAGERQNQIVTAYDSMVPTVGAKLPATPAAAEASAKVFRQITMAKDRALAAEKQSVIDQFPAYTADNQYAMGEQARQIRDARYQAAWQASSQDYAAAEQAFDREGVKIPTGDTVTEARAILKQFYSKIDPNETVPPVVERLIGPLKAEPKKATDLILPSDLAAERDARLAAEAEKTKDLSLKDANDLVRALNTAKSKAVSLGQGDKFGAAEKIQETILDAINSSKASPEAKAMYETARSNYKTNVAEPFLSETGKALGKERGGAYAGREVIKSEDVFPKFLKDGPTGMADFDRIYGKDPQARAMLNAALMDKFRGDVLTGSQSTDALAARMEKFKRDNSAALVRFPQSQSKMEKAAADLAKLKSEQDTEVARYKDIMGSPVTTEIGPLQAKTFYQNMLADPLKTRDFIAKIPANKREAATQGMVKEMWLQANPMKDGVYDAKPLLTMLHAGKTDPAKASSMQQWSEAAFGKEEGKAHMDRLEAIGNFMKREELTNPTSLKAGPMLADSPIKEATGQGAASWISAYRASKFGFTGGTYFAALGLSRFANTRVQQAFEKAQMRALYDPEMSKAILEMAATPANEAIGYSSALKVLGGIKLEDGMKLVDHLIDRGYVKKYLRRGAIYGAEKAADDQRQEAQ